MSPASRRGGRRYAKVRPDRDEGDPGRANRWRVFLSYSSSDSTIANEVKAMLEEVGIAPVFMAEKSILGGSAWEGEILDALREVECGVFLLTPNSESSRWVMFEAGAIWIQQKNVHPVAIFSTEELPEPLSRWQARSFVTVSEKRQFVEDMVKLYGSRGTT